jgi:hypothetical protein
MSAKGEWKLLRARLLKHQKGGVSAVVAARLWSVIQDISDIRTSAKLGKEESLKVRMGQPAEQCED